MISASSYDELVADIYQASIEPLRFKEALSKLVTVLAATGAHLHAVDKRSGEVVLSSSSGLSPLGEIDYVERYAKLDPRAGLAVALPVGQMLVCNHHFDDAYVERSEFYQDFLIPYGCRYVSGTKVFENDTHAAVVGVHTSTALGPLGADSLQILQRLTLHLNRAMQMLHSNARLQNQWAIMKATLDSLGYAALVCTDEGELLAGNEVALGILDQGDGLTLRDGRVSVSDAQARRALSAVLQEHEIGGAAAGVSEHVAALLVPRRSRFRAYQLIVRRIEPERTAFNSSSRLWSMMISDPDHISVPTVRALSMLYKLTPAETRIATALVSGSTPEGIARDLHVKVRTVRTQLESLFAKTGTHRQAELVRLFSAVPPVR